jgi:release factor glutamine methyltransferase
VISRIYYGVNSQILQILIQTSFLCRMSSLKQVLQRFKEELAELYDTREAESLGLIALAEIATLSSAKIKAFPDTEVTEEQAESINKILTELKTGKPIQYILGHTEFYGLHFKVNSSVLIPRPETEELVEWIISSVNSSKLAPGSILDIGTGSGCIAISLKKNLPEFAVSGMDISQSALQTAKENADLNKVDVNLLNEDILASHLAPGAAPYSIIVSNPPYVTMHDKTQMHQNVIDFEPHTALFVPENDPLIFYKAIADFASENLEPGGLLFFEINESYGEQIVELLNSKSFKNIELKNDISGRDRMIKGQIS